MIAFRNFNSTDNHAPSSVSPTKPTGNASTDILIVSMGIGCSGAAITAPTAPGGWTLVGSVVNATTGGNRVSSYVWWALGNVASTTFTIPTDHVYDVGTVICGFTGVDNTTPIDATGTANSTTNAASITSNAVTIATANAWHVVGLASWVGGTWSATFFTIKQNAGSNEDGTCAFNQVPKSTGSTGTVSFSTTGGSTNQILCAVPFALRPDAGGGGGGGPFPFFRRDIGMSGGFSTLAGYGRQADRPAAFERAGRLWVPGRKIISPLGRAA